MWVTMRFLLEALGMGNGQPLDIKNLNKCITEGDKMFPFHLGKIISEKVGVQPNLQGAQGLQFEVTFN